MDTKDLVLVVLSLAAMIIPVRFVYLVFKGRKPSYVEYVSTLIFFVYAFSDVYERLFWFVPSFWGEIRLGDEVWHADRYYYGVALGGLMSLAIMVVFVKYVALKSGEDPFDLTPPDTDGTDEDGDKE
ncbi:MAG: hypothetical protein HQK87_11480 [Nitrospinae bacterium]|nr:hypothetical protein [Nitrospinota bacterium]